VGYFILSHPVKDKCVNNEINTVSQSHYINLNTTNTEKSSRVPEIVPSLSLTSAEWPSMLFTRLSQYTRLSCNRLIRTRQQMITDHRGTHHHHHHRWLRRRDHQHHSTTTINPPSPPLWTFKEQSTSSMMEHLAGGDDDIPEFPVTVAISRRYHKWGSADHRTVWLSSSSATAATTTTACPVGRSSGVHNFSKQHGHESKREKSGGPQWGLGQNLKARGVQSDEVLLNKV